MNSISWLDLPEKEVFCASRGARDQINTKEWEGTEQIKY